MDHVRDNYRKNVGDVGRKLDVSDTILARKWGAGGVNALIIAAQVG